MTEGHRVRTSDKPLAGWRRLAERLYRLTHHGRIRTLVLSPDEQYARDYWDGKGKPWPGSRG
jgi:hypothetical protein